MAVDYKKIGLVNTKEMFARAIKGELGRSCFQLQQLGAAPGYHPGFFKLEVTCYPSGF